MKKILLLGSGELGKEFVISAQRKGQHVIACDSYAGAPAMQVADEFEVFDMLDGEALERVVEKHHPDIIVPEIEAIRTERLYDFEKEGIQVVPSARAVNFTMNRKAIRDLAAKELGLKTANYFYAKTLDELKEAAAKIGFPCVVKPLMSSSGKGQSLVKSADELERNTILFRKHLTQIHFSVHGSQDVHGAVTNIAEHITSGEVVDNGRNCGKSLRINCRSNNADVVILSTKRKRHLTIL